MSNKNCTSFEEFKSLFAINATEDILFEKWVSFSNFEFEERLKNSVDEIISSTARAYASQMKRKREIQRIKSELLNENKTN